MPTEKFRIGTRGSPLALRQTGQIIDVLKEHHSILRQPGVTEMVVVKTTGDREHSQLLAEIGGKGLFTKELDESMLRGEIDLAVHSMKDMPTFLPQGIVLHAINGRLDSRDAFISVEAGNIRELSEGATIGTASLRRKAQLLNLRPDLQIVPLRGNIGTRLDKVTSGEIDATLLAYAGLKRLGEESSIQCVIETNEILPAVGQGILAATCREDDLRANTLIAALLNPETTAIALAERAMLASLDGSCHTPIAGHAEFDGKGELMLSGMIIRPDGAEKAEVTLSGDKKEAEQLGIRVAEKLILEAGPSILESIKQTRPVLIQPQLERKTDENNSGNTRGYN